MLYGIIGALVVAIVILCIRLQKKLKLDNEAIESRKTELEQLQTMLNKTEYQIEYETDKLHELQKSILDYDAAYKQKLQEGTEEINNYIEKQRTVRITAMDLELQSKKEVYEKTLQELLKSYEEQETIAKNATADVIAELQKKIKSCEQAAEYEQEKLDSLLEPLKQYEKDKQAKLFYTIYIPDEFKEDIDFLLNTVSQKVQHPDIISKLVWAEYVKPYLDETIKRVGIKAEPGIYKLTNIDSGKAYIGKSTDIKKRIQDHFKSSVGIKSIADQFVHHEILRTGFWNWSIEYIIYCDKDDLNELEKYYIDFFKTQEYGYNRKEGG